MPLAFASISITGPLFRVKSMKTPLIETDRLLIYKLALADAKDLRAYYSDNAAHLDPWEPARSPTFHTLDACRARIAFALAEMHVGRSLQLVLRLKETRALIGVCNFTNIVRGPFQACTLGYSIAAKAEGQGLMHEALEASLKHMFEQENLHRIMANYVPENARSGQLLARLGFDVEGRAKDYLHIAGKWRDHILTAKTNPNFTSF